MYIFKLCAEQVFRRDLFQDPAVRSHIVYIYMLANDFAVRQKTLEYYVRMATPNRAQIQAIWDELRSVYERIDAEMLILYSRLSNEYRAYIDSSDFINDIESYKLPSESEINEGATSGTHAAAFNLGIDSQGTTLSQSFSTTHMRPPTTRREGSSRSRCWSASTSSAIRSHSRTWPRSRRPRPRTTSSWSQSSTT